MTINLPDLLLQIRIFSAVSHCENLSKSFLGKKKKHGY
jgi:hypothetical protein